MKQKRVSFNCAKALKEAGYKFTPAPSSFFTNETNSWFDNEDGELYSLPFALDVWLWLFLKKGKFIDVIKDCNGTFIAFHGEDSAECCESSDPEEAIIAAIEYLCENDLIK